MRRRVPPPQGIADQPDGPAVARVDELGVDPDLGRAVTRFSPRLPGAAPRAR
ncbi:hypothetical protein ACUXZZ_44495 [Streptomyces graminifolii]|uniref:hypothetical protein n=1 Tax=Streptomyces graminifolii TaxID=1266771 RepID=UPI004058D9E3